MKADVSIDTLDAAGIQIRNPGCRFSPLTDVSQGSRKSKRETLAYNAKANQSLIRWASQNWPRNDLRYCDIDARG